MYFLIRTSINIFYGTVKEPILPENVNFISGQIINAPLDLPFKFTINHPKNEKPRHFLDGMIPVVSNLFLEKLSEAGVDNFQVFPAILYQPSTGIEYTEYSAFNIIGLVDAVDDGSSEHDVIMPGNDDGILPLVDYKKLIFSKSKTHDFLMFRLPQNSVDMFIHSRVMDYLRSQKPEGGWGLTTYEIQVK